MLKRVARKTASSSWIVDKHPNESVEILKELQPSTNFSGSRAAVPLPDAAAEFFRFTSICTLYFRES